MSQPVPRAGRVLDAVGMALFGGGAAFYAAAYVAMKRIIATGYVPYQKGMRIGAVVEWERWRGISRLGLALAAAGVCVAIAAAYVAVRHRRAASRGAD